MKVTLLGTGTSQGVPVIACDCKVCQSSDERDKRLRCSVMLEIGEHVFVIDTGPDFRTQMLRENVQRLDAVIFTHEHKDHIAGLDDVRAFNFKQRQDMPLYGSANVEVALKRDFFYAFAERKYPGVPELDFRLIDNNPFEIEGSTFTPISVLHYKLPVFGFRIGGFSYVTDAKHIAPEELEKLKGSEVLVINALRKEPHISHLNEEEALRVVEQVNPKIAYFTHISHLYGRHADIEANLPLDVRIAYDGLSFELNDPQ